MGEKGAKKTPLAAISAEMLLSNLSDIEGLSTKSMFGGIGVFHEGTMFGMINSQGQIYLKADPKGLIDIASSEKHSKMPYFTVRDSDIHSHMWKAWVEASIQFSKA